MSIERKTYLPVAVSITGKATGLMFAAKNVPPKLHTLFFPCMTGSGSHIASASRRKRRKHLSMTLVCRDRVTKTYWDDAADHRRHGFDREKAVILTLHDGRMFTTTCLPPCINRPVSLAQLRKRKPCSHHWRASCKSPTSPSPGITRHRRQVSRTCC